MIAVNGETPQMTETLKIIFTLFEKMFGNAFWANTIFEVTPCMIDAFWKFLILDVHGWSGF